MTDRSRQDRPQPQRSAWRENVDSLLWALALALAIRTFVIAPFKIPSGSMRPTLIEGDRILVNKFVLHLHAPQRGDIIVFYYPNEFHPFPQRLKGLFDHRRPVGERLSALPSPGRPFIKRLVALGGDRVEIRDGRVVVNGQPLDGTGIFRANHYENQGPFGQKDQVIDVPAGNFFVLGDNSGSSQDSRFWGFVPQRLLIGKALCIFWPVPRWRLLR